MKLWAAVACAACVQFAASMTLRRGGLRRQEEEAQQIFVWPQPLNWTSGGATVLVQPGDGFFSTPTKAAADSILVRAMARYRGISFQHPEKDPSDLAAKTSLPILKGVEIHVDGAKEEEEKLPFFGMDESYTLTIDAGSAGKAPAAEIRARSVFGALRGLETFSQLVRFDPESGVYAISGAPWSIKDRPRFPHRGLMVDTARHFQPLASLRAIIDSMSYAKLNVLHWHVTDKESFPLEVKSFPKLWEGSFSEVERYTQEDVRSIVQYAAERGIRVVPEFDMPGHADSWCKGYPELCVSSFCTTPLNVASNMTWAAIGGLLSEVSGGRASQPGHPAGLFPDAFLHLGGDEVNTDCWRMSPQTSQWMHEHNFSPQAAYGYFTHQVAQMAVNAGRRPMQWSEVFDSFKSGVHPSTIVHVWKGQTNITELASMGYDIVRNVGYFDKSWYLDNLDVRWRAIYENEPCEGLPTDELCAKIIGGHGEMWGEHVDGSDLQSTVWPRMASIAEKLWSSREQTQDTDEAEPRIQHFRWVMLERGIAAAPLDVAGGGRPRDPGSSGGPALPPLRLHRLEPRRLDLLSLRATHSEVREALSASFTQAFVMGAFSLLAFAAALALSYSSGGEDHRKEIPTSAPAAPSA